MTITKEAAMEAVAKTIYDQWADLPGWVEWVAGGNSLMQDEARQLIPATLRLFIEQSEAADRDAALFALMAKHRISVWMDPDWWEGSGVPRWLAGTNIRAVEGRYYSTLTGSDPSSIEADNTANGHTPEEAVHKVVAAIQSSKVGESQ